MSYPRRRKNKKPYSRRKTSRGIRYPELIYLPCSNQKFRGRQRDLIGPRKILQSVSINSLDSETLNEFIRNREKSTVKGGGSWRVLPKDSCLVHKKRLRKKKNSNTKRQHSDDSDYAESNESRSTVKHPENKRREPYINESSSGSSSPSVVYHYVSDSTFTTNSEDEQNPDNT